MADTLLPTTLVDWLDDLTVRFLLNLPASELESIPRLCFQVEEAQWYYEDFVRPAVAASGAPPLPGLSLKDFCLQLFRHCPLLNGFSDEQHLQAYEEFLAYKVRVPVRGAILLDERMEKVVLVRGWKKGSSWSFPRGKINKDEKDLHCAIREVWEETGFDIRKAGLVPDDEDEVKAIDVTMREQNIRLFVFRGVPEDTFFEAQTRKEISKIDWYWIKDLPGFKKQKPGPQQVNGDAAQGPRFYMVAPFLGHLKKWINQQRRQDNERAKRRSANGHGLTTATEDEGVTEEEATPEPEAGEDSKSEELKRLLRIGGANTPLESQPQTQQSRLPSDSANLLAMLQGASKPTNGTRPPHTPFDQINPFPQQPESPDPHHMRLPSSSGQQHYPPPRFPLSPPEAPGRHYSLPTPNAFGPGQNGFQPPDQMAPGHRGLPPHMQQQQQLPPQRQSMPPGPPPEIPFGQENGVPSGMPFHQQQRRPPSQQMPPHMLPPHLQQQAFSHQGPPQYPFVAPQGPQGAIAQGPSAPNPSQLPAPRQLGVEKMRLLDAFRNPSNRDVPSSAAPSGKGKQRVASTHQTALLDLLRKPSHSQTVQSPTSSAVPEKIELPEPASPTGTDVTVKPSTARRPTLNEITRTLPASKPKAKSPPITSDAAAFQPPQNVFTQAQPPNVDSKHVQSRPEPPKERQLFDPNNPAKFTPASVFQQGKPEAQHQDRKRQSREFKNPTSPAINGTVAQNGHRATPPPFTILARPGSAKGGPKSPAPPPSPLRHESSKAAFHPQVLKRPKNGDAEAEPKPADKKGQLLALFGKGAAQTSPTPSPSAAPQPTIPESKPSAEDPKHHLLGLFNTGTSNNPTPTTTTAAPSTSTPPPPAPKIEPEHRPTSTRQIPTLSTTAPKPAQSQQQNLLLDLFTNKRAGTGTPNQQSPGTPISPFTLGAPAVEAQVGSLAGMVNAPTPVHQAVNAPASAGPASPQLPQDQQKNFLMGFLNGVVKSEGSRGGGGGS